MKRYILIIAALLMVMLVGCGEEEKQPLRICIDTAFLDGVNSNQSGFEGFFINYFNKKFKLYCKQEDIEFPQVEFVLLPADGVQRTTAVSKIRTELMSGEGPDLFILDCDKNEPLLEEKALFLIPEKAMEMSMFMTLDEYMENKTRFAEWDRMNQSVLAAGRTEEGQQVILLCYTFPASIYRAEEVTHEPSEEITWEEMLQSDDAALRATAVRTDNTLEYSEGMPFMVSRGPMIEFILGDLADYGKEELSFSEEELERRIEEILELADEYKAGDFDNTPAHYNCFVGAGFDFPKTVVDYTYDTGYYDVNNGIKWKDDCTVIPLYSDDGGVTAEISTFAAINRNTEYADEAFLLLDHMLSFTNFCNENMYVAALYQSGSPDTLKAYLPIYD